MGGVASRGSSLQVEGGAWDTSTGLVGLQGWLGSKTEQHASAEQAQRSAAQPKAQGATGQDSQRVLVMVD